jgi:hypothetical protein
MTTSEQFPVWILPISELPFLSAGDESTRDNERNRSLHNAGIYLIGDLLHFSASELVALPAIGAGLVAKIILWVEAHGGKLRGMDDVSRDWRTTKRYTTNLELKMRVRGTLASTRADVIRRASGAKPFCYDVANYPN